MFSFKSEHDDPSRIYEEKVFSAFLSFLPPALSSLIWGTSLAWETWSVYGLVTQHHLRVLLRVQKRQMKAKHTQFSILHMEDRESMEGGSGCLRKDWDAAACITWWDIVQKWKGHFVTHRCIHFAVERRGDWVQEAQAGVPRFMSLTHLPLFCQEPLGIKAWLLARKQVDAKNERMLHPLFTWEGIFV